MGLYNVSSTSFINLAIFYVQPTNWSARRIFCIWWWEMRLLKPYCPKYFTCENYHLRVWVVVDVPGSQVKNRLINDLGNQTYHFGCALKLLSLFYFCYKLVSEWYPLSVPNFIIIDIRGVRNFSLGSLTGWQHGQWILFVAPLLPVLGDICPFVTPYRVFLCLTVGKDMTSRIHCQPDRLQDWIC